MKKMKFLVFPALLLSLQAMSQTKTPSDGSVGKTINKVGNKTAQIAVKATSGIKDKKYASKVGPNGETVYINKNSNYYYVNGKGKKVYVSKAMLKDKPM